VKSKEWTEEVIQLAILIPLIVMAVVWEKILDVWNYGGDETEEYW